MLCHQKNHTETYNEFWKTHKHVVFLYQTYETSWLQKLSVERMAVNIIRCQLDHWIWDLSRHWTWWTFCHIHDSDVMQPGGDAGEETSGSEGRPGEWGGLSQRAGGPADGNINTYTLAYFLTAQYEQACGACVSSLFILWALLYCKSSKETIMTFF